MASKMIGIKGFRKALRRAPADLREGVYSAVKETVDAVHARGKANIAAMVQQQSGELSRNYRRSVGKKSLTGRVGYLSGKARDNAFYARFINDGTKNMAARPFHTNAVNAERERDTDRMVKARDIAIETMIRRNQGE